MTKTGIAFLFLIAFLSSSQHSAPLSKSAFLRQYRYAESAEIDSVALAAYLQSIKFHPGPPDTLLADAHYKAAIYLQTAGRFADAIPYLKMALNIDGLLNIPDSIRYLPTLYLGNSYYSVGYIDSASIAYRKAERIAEKYPDIPGMERLYNTIGVLHYESGDYKQASFYFEKAISKQEEKKNTDKYLLVNYKSNLASALRRAGNTEEALKAYESLLKENINTDELLHNIGSIYLETGRDSTAIAYLQKLSYQNATKMIDLAVANIHLQKYPQARTYLDEALALARTASKNYKNLQAGLVYKYRGDLFLAESNADSALLNYQLALVQLVAGFESTNIRNNPEKFEGQFFVNELFETLVAKAHAFTIRYKSSNDTSDLVSSIATYQTVYHFADLVSLNYNSDDARMQLNSRKHLSHNEPIENCLMLFSRTNNRRFLEQAFSFDELNKASVLHSNLQQAKLRENAEIPQALLLEEAALKKNITALNLRARGTTDPFNREAIQSRLRDESIKLAALRNKFQQYPHYRVPESSLQPINLQAFQKMIPADCAVISYHFGEAAIVCFVVTAHSFDVLKTSMTINLADTLVHFNRLLRRVNENNRVEIDRLASVLYQQLLMPAKDKLEGFKNLMIIPDDELNLVPFEVLRDGRGQYVIKNHTVTYNYSCTLLEQAQPAVDLYPALAMAPFSNSSTSEYPQLKESADEIANLRGTKISGPGASKKAFLKNAPNFGTIHLATHASANDYDPSQSFIAFADSKLYAEEISDLSLKKTRLVVLSACETGDGQLVKGEGLMSLARAFAVAGCTNTITSLWKADDRSTSLLCSGLHRELDKGNGIAEALQMSINKYMENSTVSGREKTPAFWAHLRLTGGFAEPNTSHHYFWLAIIIIAVLSVIIFSRLRP